METPLLCWLPAQHRLLSSQFTCSEAVSSAGVGLRGEAWVGCSAWLSRLHTPPGLDCRALGAALQQFLVRLAWQQSLAPLVLQAQGTASPGGPALSAQAPGARSARAAVPP